MMMNSNKQRRSLWIACAAAVSCAPRPNQQSPVASAHVGAIRARYELPALPLAALQNAHLPDSIANDRRIQLGGVGSDLWHGPKDAADEFWMVTDRGPNGEVEVDGKNRRTMLVPQFTPHIVHVRAGDGALAVLDTIALVGQSGRPVTGMSNLAEHDEPPYDATGRNELAYNVNGLDTEGLVRTSAGEFWLADEYGPSLVRVASTGQVVKRYVPAGLELPGADYAIAQALPALYSMRKNNRGFEGLALSRDEKTLYLLLQSPLSVPDKKTGSSSRHARILAFDIASEKPFAEYVYRIEVAGDVDPNAAGEQDAMRLSAIVALDAQRLLVLERTDDLAKLFVVDLEGATNILGSPWDDARTTPSLEALPDLTAAQVRPLAKRLAVDLAALKQLPRKIEGVAALDAKTIAIANDNDFDVGALDAAGNNLGGGAKSRLIVIALDAPLF